MQPRTMMALAVSAGLTVATGVLAVGTNLLPSGAQPRPAPVPAVAEEPPTTVVTQFQDVFDPASPAPGADQTVPAPSSDDSQGLEASDHDQLDDEATEAEHETDDDTHEATESEHDDHSSSSETSSSSEHDD